MAMSNFPLKKTLIALSLAMSMMPAFANASSYRHMWVQCNEKFNGAECTKLGLYHIRKRGEDVSGVQYLQRACKLDNARACTILGNIFKDGKHACKDPFLAKRYFHKACVLGSSIACERYNHYRPYVVYRTKSIKEIVDDLFGKKMNEKCRCGTSAAPVKECIRHTNPK